ncbi:MAG: hypothetical protein ACP6IY_18825 [Promethearchaeia archaeon]
MKLKNFLDRAYDKLAMIIERIFGKEIYYYERLKEIKTFRIVPARVHSGMKKEYIYEKIKKDLLRKRDRYVILIDTIIDKLRIEKEK